MTLHYHTFCACLYEIFLFMKTWTTDAEKTIRMKSISESREREKNDLYP